MADFKLTVVATATNPVVHDLHLENNTLVLVEDEAESFAQHLRIRLQFFRGEWFLDTRLGVPYLQRIFAKGVTSNLMRAVFSRVILGTPGCAALESLTVAFNRATREATLTFVARLESGRVFRSSDFQPFIVEIG